MANGPRFSIVIPCFNEAGYLTDALLSLQKQDFDGAYEIIVVDNGCTDETAGIARDLDARVVLEPVPGVCNARQRGTEAARGEFVVSADADTIYGHDWLSRIDARFRSDERIVAVVGPCRYADGPRWGRLYGRMLFGAVDAAYRLTGRAVYASATNIAFRRAAWTGYDTSLTQGGDELDQLRRLRKKGRVVYDHANPTFTSGRRLARGLPYNLFVTLPVHYVLTYAVNRIAGRRVLGSAPAFRDHAGSAEEPAEVIVLTALVLLAILGAAYWWLMSPFAPTSRDYPYHGPAADRVVALTFDDGPNEPYTSQILDILGAHDIRATFFHVGQCVERHPEVARRAFAAGHILGNHSLSHRFGTYLRPRAYEREVARTQRILTGITGRTSALARTPWLWRQPALLRMLRRHGLQPIAGEFCHALEVFQPSGVRMARRAVGKTRPGSILIFHDGFDGRGGNRAETVVCVRETIKGLRARGYRFVTVDELLGVPAYQP